jgi:hypothetical protein
MSGNPARWPRRSVAPVAAPISPRRALRRRQRRDHNLMSGSPVTAETIADLLDLLD